MMKEKISEVIPTVFRSTYISNDPDDYTAGGCVRIHCCCGFVGHVEVDDDGRYIRGECSECGTSFKQVV